ncbi:MAG: glycosyltransferase [Gemmatimonadota bacterium]|nr:glycosyltransferase [Gemmatimonadota bacterium]
MALQASDLPRSQWELIVADDGSTDDTPLVAAAIADRVVRVADGPRGPGFARNDASHVATGDILVFVDADVCVSTTALGQFDALFRANPGLGAAFGAYDTSPDAPGFISQYRNLLHHYVHSLSPGPAITFWAGCGAMRRDVFEEMGGFDVQRYTRPQIEDIELGYRLAARGIPILLCPEIQGKHLKRWTLRGGFITDFRDRGVPWMQLLMERREVAAAGPLNLQAREKLFTALAPLGVIFLLAAAAFHSLWMLFAGAAALALVIAGNAPLLRWFAGMRGGTFALGIVPLRLAYYVLNAFSGAWGALLHFASARRGGSRPNDSFSTSRVRS